MTETNTITGDFGLGLPSTDFDPIETGKKIAKETVVLELHIRAPGFTRTINSKSFLAHLGTMTAEEIAALTDQERQIIADYQSRKEQSGKTDPSFLHISQDLIDYKEIKSIATHDNKFAEWVVGRSVPSPMLAHGLYLVPLSMAEEIDGAIKNFVQQRRKLVDHFEEKYTALKLDAETKRGPFFNEGDYPPFKTIREKYRVEARYLSFNVPAALEQINRELYEREKQKVSLQWAEAAQDVRDALRVGFQGLVDHFAERLGKDEKTGKPKVFHGTAVTKLQEFLTTFENRDLTNDAELASLVSQAKQLVQGVDPADLRKDDGLRTALETGFNQIAEQADSLITVRERKFSLDDYDNEEDGEALELAS